MNPEHGIRDLRHIAELACEGGLLVRRDVLAREEHHEMVEDGAPDLGRNRSVRFPAEIDARYLGADHRVDRPDGDVPAGFRFGDGRHDVISLNGFSRVSRCRPTGMRSQDCSKSGFGSD